MRFFQGLKSWLKTFVWVLYVIAIQGWQLAGVAIIAIYNQRPWECIFLLIGFWTGRRFFGSTYHFKTMLICTAATWISFYFLTAGLPSFYISYTLPCIFGIVLAFALSKISELIEGRKGDE